MIYEHLLEGEQNAISGKELCSRLNLTLRELSKAVEADRRSGKPICASCNGARPGYYIPANREEMETYCKRLHHRAGEIYKTRDACLSTLDGLPTANKQSHEDLKQ